MLLRRPHDLAGLFREGRRRAGWSQRELADRIGVSRQWVSLVETGKTTVEFDLVLASLQALGYGLFIESVERTGASEAPPEDATAARGKLDRTPLTRHGEPLGRRTRHRRSATRDDES